MVLTEVIMVEFIGAPCSTLLVEPDDQRAEHDTRMLKQFPGAVVHRAKTKEEALSAIDHGPNQIDQVCINGQVWTISQALPMIRAMGDPAAAQKAKQRPANFNSLSPREQWEIDKRLGILDWDGR
jgi:hypothetical protein